MCADTQHACCIANAARIHRHGDDLLLHVRGLTDVGVVQQKRTTGTGLLAAAVPLLTLPGVAMADNIRTMTIGTMQDLEDHEATQ